MEKALTFFSIVGLVDICATAYLIVTNIDHITTPNWLDMNLTISSDEDGLSLISADALLLKDLPNKVFWSISMLQYHENGTYLPTIFKSNVEMCVFLKKSTNIPIFQFIYSKFRKIGRVPINCPIKAGHYFFNNYKVEHMPGIPANFFKKFLVKSLAEHVLANRTKLALSNLLCYMEAVD